MIAEKIDLEFNSGFTVLTGETGAGKSILIDALSLAMGARGNADQVRHGCERAEINATFDISESSSLTTWLVENELQGDPGICLLRRMIDSKGRSRGFINGYHVTLQQLRAVGKQLVDIHGQHAYQSLLQHESQQDLLDVYADNYKLVKAVKYSYQNWQQLLKQRLAMEQNTANYQQELEQLEYQSQELSNLNFSSEEWQILQDDHKRLSHTASLLEATETGLEILSENETTAISQINAVNNKLSSLLEVDSRLKIILDLLASAQVELQESVYELKDYRKCLELDPKRLQEIDERLTAVHTIARKYRVTPDELPDYLSRITQRLKTLRVANDSKQLKDNEILAQDKYLKLAKELSKIRKTAAQQLTLQVSSSMQTLAMPGGQFSVVLNPHNQGNSYGLEQIEFYVSTHKGLPLKPLAKVASGGELSRISLAIQVIASKTGTTPTLIFDEVDAGIGGRVAEIVGKLLKQLGVERQVLCVTHLAQVASAGDQQWQASKHVDQSNSAQISSAITVLKPQERIEEIARMLGGMEITATTRKHAAEMLKNSQLKND